MIAVNSLIQSSQVGTLVGQTGTISIHGHVRISDCFWEIIDVDEEKKRGETGALWNTNFYIPNIGINPINPTKLFPVRYVGFKPREFKLLYTVELELFAENVISTVSNAF